MSALYSWFPLDVGGVHSVRQPALELDAIYLEPRRRRCFGGVGTNGFQRGFSSRSRCSISASGGCGVSDWRFMRSTCRSSCSWIPSCTFPHSAAFPVPLWPKDVTFSFRTCSRSRPERETAVSHPVVAFRSLLTLPWLRRFSHEPTDALRFARSASASASFLQSHLQSTSTSGACFFRVARKSLPSN
jgi:hypothetical protein